MNIKIKEMMSLEEVKPDCTRISISKIIHFLTRWMESTGKISGLIGSFVAYLLL